MLYITEKWPHYKIKVKYKKIITKTHEKKIRVVCSGTELLIKVIRDDGLIRPKHAATILIF
jgi:hypothetical protein